VLALIGTTSVFILVSRWSTCTLTGKRAKEMVLKQDLQTMRRAIDSFTLDKQRALESLRTLVDEKYLQAIPMNPFTRRADWVPHYGETELPDGRLVAGLDDVHARPPYTEW